MAFPFTNDVLLLLDRFALSSRALSCRVSDDIERLHKFGVQSKRLDATKKKKSSFIFLIFTYSQECFSDHRNTVMDSSSQNEIHSHAGRARYLWHSGEPGNPQGFRVKLPLLCIQGSQLRLSGTWLGCHPLMCIALNVYLSRLTERAARGVGAGWRGMLEGVPAGRTAPQDPPRKEQLLQENALYTALLVLLSPPTWRQERNITIYCRLQLKCDHRVSMVFQQHTDWPLRNSLLFEHWILLEWHSWSSYLRQGPTVSLRNWLLFFFSSNYSLKY